MKQKHIAGLFACLILFGSLADAREAAPELWYWQHTHLSSEPLLDASKALVDRAAKAGYNGVAFWDVTFSTLSEDFAPIDTEDRLKDLMKYAVSKHMKVMGLAAPFGYSNDALEADPNWAEAERVIGTQFRVDASGRRLDLVNSFPGLHNGGFEDGKSAWFSTGDAGIGLSTTVSHSGKNSGVIVDASGNARFRQTITLKPWRQYHLRIFYKAQNFRGSPMLEILDASNYDKKRLAVNLENSATHDWKQVDYAFDSGDTTRADLYFGIWGGSSGILWFDDVELEETALVYVTRRSGTPVRVYDPENPATVFRERTDYEYIRDPRMASTRDPFTDSYHDPAPVKLPNKTHLRPGQLVAMDFYAAFPIPGAYGVSMCLTEPGVLKWLDENAKGLRRIMPHEASVLLSYDEIRQMNSCGSCRAKHMTAGQLLGWSVGQSLNIYGSALPGSQFYIWSDMFDPYHNAVNHYYYVEGDLAGSWKALPSSVTIMNWNLGRLKESLTWFSGLDPRQPTPHQQIIAGYYDSAHGARAATEELAAAHGIPGITGLMYTTWNNDYSQLESFANAARQNWSAYTQSIAKNQRAGLDTLYVLSTGSFTLLAGILIFLKRLR